MMLDRLWMWCTGNTKIKECVVFQADTRPIHSIRGAYVHLGACSEANQEQVKRMGFDYHFEKMWEIDGIDPRTQKAIVVRDFLQKNLGKYKNAIFLDSDAVLKHKEGVKEIIKLLNRKKEKVACFTIDLGAPKGPINGGAIVLKINKKAINAYDEIVQITKKDNSYWNCFPHDQYYIWQYIQRNREQFILFEEDVMGMWHSEIIEHKWSHPDHRVSCQEPKVIKEIFKQIKNDPNDPTINIDITKLEEKIFTGIYR